MSSSPFDGLAVAVSTVPLVLSGVFVLAELNRISGGGAASAGGGGEIEGAGLSSKGHGDDVDDSAGNICADGADLAAYLEVMLESSLLCAVWEVSSGALSGAVTRGCEFDSAPRMLC